ncbi:MAG TPA: tetratricopeptide repeat protein [Candidatus Angelobacter sp.]|jgi:tetratricopeptide (TPR) repeat protein
MMMTCCILLMALLLPPQRWTAQISGQILDRDGKPMAGAHITYKNVGIVEDPDTEHPRIIEGTGRTYKIKTDKKGSFVMIGVDYGIYEVEVKAPDGSVIYTDKRRVGDNADRDAANVLTVDLSKAAPVGAVAPGAETNLAAEKKGKEQEQLIHQENANAAKINRLVIEFHGALRSQDWPGAIKLLEQLIAIDPNRWEFYQNLGTIQANLTHYEDAIQSFAKGAEVAEKILPNAADQEEAKKNIGDLLVSEGDAYNRLGKLDEALALYTKAAGISSKPAMAHYHACNALINHGKTAEAVERCKQAIAKDPAQWEFYQVLAGAEDTLGKKQDAIETYRGGVEAAKKMLAANPDAGHTKNGMGQMLNSEGNLLVHQKKYDESLAVFSQAAEVSAYPAMPYFNLCATYFNLKRPEEALAACDNALKSDPTMADAYYIKASVLFTRGREIQGVYSAPAGTSEALNKYLQYAPNGPHVNAVHQMINRLDGAAPGNYQPAKP